jgi:pyrimidine operon attenuation protein/uracil phosphoribosyltransferase
MSVDRESVLDAAAVRELLDRLAGDIVRFAGDRAHGLVLVGIQRRGVELAERLAERIAERHGVEIHRGALDITLYRDDLETVGPRPIVGETHIPVDIADREVVIVDDVLYTGRTVRAALNELADFGRPARIGLCVLVDRGGRELPIQPDIVGLQVEAGPGDRVDVLVAERDGRDAVELVHRGGA